MRASSVKVEKRRFYISAENKRQLECLVEYLIELLDQIEDDDPNDDPLEDMEAWWQGWPEFRA